MADFGVYLEVTNNLGTPLYYLKSDLVDATYDGPSLIPGDGVPHVVHLGDPHFARGAEGTVYFTANVAGELRQYAWAASCPVWSPNNSASGPGVLRYNVAGHPLTVTIAISPATPDWSPVSQLIEHVFLLMLENRSFDQMLGFSAITGIDAVTGKPTSVDGLDGSQSNEYGGVTYPVTAPADFVMPIDPGHEFTDVLTQLAGPGADYPFGGVYPAITDAGYVDDYVSAGGGSSPGEIMKSYAASQLPVLTALAKDFAVCDGWFASMPGPTWPNRFFSLASSSTGLDHSPSLSQILSWGVTGVRFANGTIFDALEAHRGDASWRIYAGDLLPMSFFLKGVRYADIRDFDSQFASDLATGDYPAAFTLIEPAYGDVIGNTYVGGTSEHPMDDVTHGEGLIKATYEAIRNSSVWNSSLLIVTWDEHGGFYDHSCPGVAIAPDDTAPGSAFNEFGFTFEQYGPRVPAVVVSPLVPANLIDHRTYDHSSIPATVERIFGLSPLTARDAAANDVASLASLPSPRQDAPTRLPEPAESGGPGRRELAFAAGQQAFPDDVRPADTGNLPGFLGVALRLDIELDPDNSDAAVLRASQVEKRADARDYINSVMQKLNVRGELRGMDLIDR
jgi:phospholipase C